MTLLVKALPQSSASTHRTLTQLTSLFSPSNQTWFQTNRTHRNDKTKKKGQLTPRICLPSMGSIVD